MVILPGDNKSVSTLGNQHRMQLKHLLSSPVGKEEWTRKVTEIQHHLFVTMTYIYLCFTTFFQKLVFLGVFFSLSSIFFFPSFLRAYVAALFLFSFFSVCREVMLFLTSFFLPKYNELPKNKNWNIIKRCRKNCFVRKVSDCPWEFFRTERCILFWL